MSIKHQSNPPQIPSIPKDTKKVTPLSNSLVQCLMIYYACQAEDGKSCDGCPLVGYAGVGNHGDFGDICEVFAELDEALLSEGPLGE